MAQTPLLDTDFFKYGNVMPYVFEKDANGTKVSPSLAYIKNAGGLFVPVSAADPMPVTAGASMVTPAVILQNGVGATGAGTPMNVAGLATVAFTLSGTFVATVTFEVTTVATNPQPADWFLLNVHQSGTTNPPTTTATAPGIYRSSVAGFAAVRARVSAWTSGTVTVTGTAVAVEDTSKVVSATFTGSILTNAEAADGTAKPTKAFMVGGTDGTNLQVPRVFAAPDGQGGMPGWFVNGQQFSFNGAAWDRVRVASVYKYAEQGALAGATALTVWTPAAGKKIRLMGATILAGASGQMKLRMGTAGAGANVVTVGGANGDTYYVNFGQGKLATNANDVLEVFNNNAGATSVWVAAWGTEE